MLKINLFGHIKKSFNHILADVKDVTSPAVEAAKSSKTGTNKFVPKFTTPIASTAVTPKIIRTGVWKAFKADGADSSKKSHTVTLVSHRVTCRKQHMQSETDEGESERTFRFFEFSRILFC